MDKIYPEWNLEKVLDGSPLLYQTGAALEMDFDIVDSEALKEIFGFKKHSEQITMVGDDKEWKK